MHVAVVGTGYVGLVSGACFSEFGHHVTCVDKDEKKIEGLKQGEMPIYEPGLQKLVENNAEAGRLKFTTDLAEAMKGADAVFIAVGTPSRRGLAAAPAAADDPTEAAAGPAAAAAPAAGRPSVGSASSLASPSCTPFLISSQLIVPLLLASITANARRKAASASGKKSRVSGLMPDRSVCFTTRAWMSAIRFVTSARNASLSSTRQCRSPKSTLSFFIDPLLLKLCWVFLGPSLTSSPTPALKALSVHTPMCVCRPSV